MFTTDNTLAEVNRFIHAHETMEPDGGKAHSWGVKRSHALISTLTPIQLGFVSVHLQLYFLPTFRELAAQICLRRAGLQESREV